MALTYEAHESQSSSADGSLELLIRIGDVYDREEAVSRAFAIAPAVFQSRIRSERPDIRPAGWGLWDATFKYSLPEDSEEEEDPPEGGSTPGTIEFDTTGGTQHITTAISQTKYPGNAPDRFGAIGVSWNDGNPQVEGVDVVVPAFRFSITKRFSAAALQGGQYFLNLSRLTGKTNNSTYTAKGRFQGVNLELPFEAGELLFMGARGSGSGSTDFEINFQFEAQQNRTNIDIIPQGTEGHFGVASKKGHEFMWVAFENNENTQTLVQKPSAAYVAKVYQEGDFLSVLGF